MTDPKTPFPNPFPYRKQPFEKQREALNRSAFERSFALFMEMGTGKSFVTINTAAAQWFKGWINCMIVVAPKGVHSNWITEEIPKWMPESVPYTLIHWRTGRMTSQYQRAKTRAAIADTSKLLILAINTDAIAHKVGKGLVDHILRKRPSLLVIDESSDIAHHDTNRSRAAHRLARFAYSRRILNGTPGDPLRLYSQFLFLDWRFLGQEKWRDYQLRWAEWDRISTGTVDAKTKQEKYFLVQKKDFLTGKPVFKDVDELQRRMYEHAFRCTKDECFDLPPKLYTKIFPTLNAEQHRMYAELLEDYETTFKDGALVTVANKLVLYLRLQQIICGYVPVDKQLTLDQLLESEPERMIEGPNDRLYTLMDYVEHAGSTQGIIWSRFKMDMKLITRALRERGASFVEYHGGIKSDDARTLAKQRFQAGEVQWFLGNPKSGGRGNTLTAARLMAYYSNYFGLENRQQSEDRAHRYGTISLTITDWTTPGTVDEIIVRALRNGKEVADDLTGDIPKPWI
jgi:SNF2 family DNA or RNA helicase